MLHLSIGIQKKKICIYFEHPISEPILETKIMKVDDVVDSSDRSSSDDDYDSAEDELYKPPPTGLEDVSDEDEKDSLKKKKNPETKNQTSL